jgi:PKD repeat protein
VSFYDLSLGLLTDWEWDFNNDGTVDSYERNPVHAYDEPGNYTVSLEVFDDLSNQTVKKTDYITVVDPVFIEDKKLQSNIEIYPNPVRDKLHVRMNYQKELVDEIIVFNMNYEQLKKFQANDSEVFIIDVSTLKKGTYLLYMKGENHSFVKKFVKIEN